MTSFPQSLTNIFENINDRKVPAPGKMDHSAKEIVHPKELGSRGGLEEEVEEGGLAGRSGCSS